LLFLCFPFAAGNLSINALAGMAVGIEHLNAEKPKWSVPGRLLVQFGTPAFEGFPVLIPLLLKDYRPNNKQIRLYIKCKINLLIVISKGFTGW